jgi:uncharacterized protein
MAKKSLLPWILVILLASTLILFLVVGPEETSENNIGYSNETRFAAIGNASVVTMRLPAVDADGNGVLTDMAVEIRNGTGRILVDINNLFFWADTQQSIKLARDVAEKVSGINASNFDLVYNVYANASLIGGPSAGAAITLATIAALEGKTINESVMITGTVNSDGSIGKVGDVFEKSQAARDGNATLFLVPEGQGSKAVTKTTKDCKMYGIIELCSIDQISERISIDNKTGIKVIEVKNIKDALQYFMR